MLQRLEYLKMLFLYSIYVRKFNVFLMLSCILWTLILKIDALDISRMSVMHFVSDHFLAYQTGFSAVFTSDRKSHLTPPWCKITRALNDVIFECCSPMKSLEHL